MTAYRHQALDEKDSRKAASRDLVSHIRLCVFDADLRQFHDQILLAHMPALQLGLEDALNMGSPVSFHGISSEKMHMPSYSMLLSLTTPHYAIIFDAFAPDLMANAPTLPPFSSRQDPEPRSGGAHVGRGSAGHVPAASLV
jgi:hypothetical protein